MLDLTFGVAFLHFFAVKSTIVPELEGEEGVESILAMPGF